MIDNNLSMHTQVVSVSSGSVICREGDANDDHFYLVMKGTVTTFKNYGTAAETKIISLSPGEFWGEMTLFLGRKQSVTAVADTPAEIIKINRQSAGIFFQSQPEATFSIIKALCQKLDAAKLAYQGLYMQVRGEVKAQPQKGAQAQPVHKPTEPAAPVPEKPLQAAEAKMEWTIPAQGSTDTLPVEDAGIYPLFPEGHKTYRLPLLDPDSEQGRKYLYAKSYTCPQCGTKFASTAVKASKLINERVDPDGRVHYKDVEPLYYEVATCPACSYSNLGESFAEGIKKPDVIQSVLKGPKAGLSLAGLGEPIKSLDVFAGYYMAILCAPVCMMKSELLLGKLWLKLSRIYADCGDSVMEINCVRKSLDFYILAYTKHDFSPRHIQQLNYMIGDLWAKLGDYKSARNYLYKARIERDGSPAVKRQASDRIEQLKEQLGVE